MSILLYVSTNASKYGEVRAAIHAGAGGYQVDHVDLQLRDTLSINPREVLTRKATEAFSQIRHPFFMDHSALYFESMNYELPGCLIDQFFAVVGWPGLVILAGETKRVISRTALVFCDGKHLIHFQADTTGELVSIPRGENGFGWDAIFVPDGDSRTFAEMSQVSFP